jgi:hypothetical protein
MKKQNQNKLIIKKKGLIFFNFAILNTFFNIRLPLF